MLNSLSVLSLSPFPESVMNEERREYLLKSIRSFVALEGQAYDKHEAKGVVHYQNFAWSKIGAKLAELATTGGWLPSVSGLTKTSNYFLVNMVLQKRTNKTSTEVQK